MQSLIGARPLLPIAALTLAAALSACGQKLLSVPTIGDLSHTCFEDLEGFLVDDPVWVIAIRRPPSVTPTLIFWPDGFGAIEDRGRLALVDGSHRVIAHVGDFIRAKGDLVGKGTGHAVCG